MTKTRKTPRYFHLRKTTEARRRIPKKLRFHKWFDVFVALPPLVQTSGAQPDLVRQLNQHWGVNLSNLRCSTGDFGLALNEGRVSLGHVWAEIYCLWLDIVSAYLGCGRIKFSEEYRPQTLNGQGIEYRVRLFFSHELPDQLGGLEQTVTAYLNKVMEGDWVSLVKWMVRYIADRRRPVDEKALEASLEGLLRRPQDVPMETFIADYLANAHHGRQH